MKVQGLTLCTAKFAVYKIAIGPELPDELMQLPSASYRGLPLHALISCDQRMLHTYEQEQDM